MNIWIGIPTGQRADKAAKVAQAWRSQGVNVYAFCWDKETFDIMDGIATRRMGGNRQSFAVLHNLMVSLIPDFDIYICGADDLYPDIGIDKLEQAAKQFPDKVLCIEDGIQTNLPTHPVITKGWYEKHQQIFDEKFNHNFCDTDLLFRTFKDDEIVKITGIKFDHRHPLKTGKAYDEIHRIGQSTFEVDKKYFLSKHPAGMLLPKLQECYV